MAVRPFTDTLRTIRSGLCVEELATALQSVVLAEGTLHVAIAPKADQTKQWRIKAEILGKALDWSADALQPEQARRRADLARALDSGEVPVRPGRPLALEDGPVNTQ